MSFAHASALFENPVHSHMLLGFFSGCLNNEMTLPVIYKPFFLELALKLFNGVHMEPAVHAQVLIGGEKEILIFACKSLLQFVEGNKKPFGTN